MSSPAPDPAPTASRRRTGLWLLFALALIVTAVLFALVLAPGGQVDAGPVDPSTDEPSSTAGPVSPTTDPTDDPSDDPTDAPTDDPTDAPDTSSPTPDPSNSPTPTDPPATGAPSGGAPSGGTVSTAPGELGEEEASELITLAVAPVPASVTTDSQLSASLSDVAIDAYAEELEAQWLELSSQGWSLSGSPTVAELEITALDDSSDPVTAEVSACIDSSDMRMADADGEPIGDPSATTPHALHLFTMVQAEDGSWRVASHSFPDDPRC